MSTYYRVTMYLEVDEDKTGDPVQHVRECLEHSEAVHNCDVESCDELIDNPCSME